VLAPKHPFLLHAILAVSSLHLSYLNPNESKHHLQTAAEHQARALRLFRAVVEAPSHDKAIPAFICSALFAYYYFTSPMDAGMLLFNEERDGPPDWMQPLRGCGALVHLFKSNQATFTGFRKFSEAFDSVYNVPKDVEDYEFSTKAVLRILRDQFAQGDEEREIYFTAIKELERCFAVSDQGAITSQKAAVLMFTVSVSTDFLNRLHQKTQPALVIMAFWCVLMHRVPKMAWLENGKATEMLDVLMGLMTPESLGLIQWPREKILGIRIDE
jgi:hypothetical protein